MQVDCGKELFLDKCKIGLKSYRDGLFLVMQGNHAERNQQIKMSTATELTRKQKERLIYRHTHRDYKGNGSILVLRGATHLVPMSQLTDAEIEAKLPYALTKEAAHLSK